MTDVTESALARVLIVEDNPDIAKVLGILVQHIGYEVRIVNDALSSLVVAREFQPHIALLDIGLPVMSGYELARRLRSEAGMDGALLVALTGYAQDEDFAQSREAGFDIHLVKPVTLDSLQQALEQHRRP